MKPIFDPSGGYRKLDAFLFASLIQLETKRYCERYLTLKNDPKGRQFDQMTQAARSGRANIMEGSQRASTSKADEIRLVDVARASLVELMGDFEMELLQRGSPPWSRDSDEAKRVSEWQLEPHGEWTDPIHDSGVYLLAQQRRLSPFTDAGEIATANMLLILCKRTVVMLSHLLQSQGESFAERGGFKERLTKVRIEARDGEAPSCPKCGSPMRKRTARSGPNAGSPFWGCSRWPDCDGKTPAK